MCEKAERDESDLQLALSASTLQPGCSHRSGSAVRDRGVGEGRRGRCDAEEATD